MMCGTQKLVYDRNYDNFTLRYYLTERKTETSPRQPFYGAMLVKTCKNGIESEREAVLLSECKEKTLRVIHVLHKMEVTPLSLFEVIDTVTERLLFNSV
jgi:hypothetical protein